MCRAEYVVETCLPSSPRGPGNPLGPSLPLGPGGPAAPGGPAGPFLPYNPPTNEAQPIFSKLLCSHSCRCLPLDLEVHRHQLIP